MYRSAQDLLGQRLEQKQLPRDITGVLHLTT
jgi:hypothetical protein